MKINIQAIKFDATERLVAYAEKKVGKLEKFFDEALQIDVNLKIVKPESALNKEAEITLFGPGVKLFASKVEDTFEQAIDECVSAIEKQVEKLKEKR